MLTRTDIAVETTLLGVDLADSSGNRGVSHDDGLPGHYWGSHAVDSDCKN